MPPSPGSWSTSINTLPATLMVSVIVAGSLLALRSYLKAPAHP